MKNKIEAFFIVYKVIKINANGTPMIFKRSSPRDDIKINEKQIEKIMVDRMDLMNFQPGATDAIRWLKQILDTPNVAHAEAKAFAMVFCYLINQKPLTRDYYRRFKSCILWLEENLYQISYVCSKIPIYILCNGLHLTIYPPFAMPPFTSDDIIIIDPKSPEDSFEEKSYS